SAPTHDTTVAKIGTGPEELKLLEIVMKAMPGDTPPANVPLQFKTTAGTFRLLRNPGQPGETILLELPADAPDLAWQIAQVCKDQVDLDVEFTLPELSATIDIAGGADAAVSAYTDALGELVDVQDVDLVIASVQDLSNQRAAQIYGAVISHCELMSADAKGRLGFGQVPPANDLEANVDLVGSLISDRFALFAPHGVLGAAVGRIGSLPYFHSPTFKTLAGLGQLEPSLRVEAQQSYLKAKIVPVAELPGRGNVVVRGLTTDGDQINVRRVADRAVRGVKQIGELFIGKLNTEDGRNALKQKLNEFLLQMASESAIVPSTDGSDPAFKLDVFSTQADFALGIVRVDMAIRPVRAIDYIYATVLVQV
ncbi:MAG TPA: phage tail sheath C-terminal domain-containing protein, partial [Enhygromyxa sp.]|nr:phage tail sheath C-terminal domain-containing protein [Enhygromyxa sp.]